jgi:hypothetical protein
LQVNETGFDIRQRSLVQRAASGVRGVKKTAGQRPAVLSFRLPGDR